MPRDRDGRSALWPVELASDHFGGPRRAIQKFWCAWRLRLLQVIAGFLSPAGG
jgi:hypothetical protein